VRFSLVLGLLALAACRPAALHDAPPRDVAVSADDDAPLAFDRALGDRHDHLLRVGHVAAHVVTTSGAAPRFLVAFPAGNMGAALWFDAPAGRASLDVAAPLMPIDGPDGRGVAAEVTSDAPALSVHRAVLGSVRAIRDYATSGVVAPEAAPSVEFGSEVIVKRTTLDGAHHVVVALAPEGGTVARAGGGDAITLAAPAGGHVAFRATVVSDEPPLTPLSARAILAGDPSGYDPRLVESLSFLTFDEKLVAGSWRFLTYFGRDTLLSIAMLLPVLRPAAVEAGLAAVLDRASDDGEVAHEEDIGEWAVKENLAAHSPGDPRTPRFDRKMIDGDFLLPAVLARYLLDTDAGRARADAFLARRAPSGATYCDVARRNAARVLRLAAPFAERGTADALVALKPGVPVGNWRDSEDGLGGGRIPYDVNAVLVPAALEAIARLADARRLGGDASLGAGARPMAERWSRAAPLFDVEIAEADARERIRAYAGEIGVDAAAALASIDGPVRFPALSLDATLAPIAVMNSDVGFALFFGDPPPPVLDAMAHLVTRPFPAGLATPVGMVVANPALAQGAALRARFGKDAYHGTVVWSWQEALLAAGLRRQSARADLPAPTRAAVVAAEALLWDAIDRTQGMQSDELWSFSVDGGVFHAVPFGQGAGQRDESNAVQLWSTVFLAVRRPHEQ
jgi:hypothetical protein